MRGRRVHVSGARHHCCTSVDDLWGRVTLEALHAVSHPLWPNSPLTVVDQRSCKAVGGHAKQSVVMQIISLSGVGTCREPRAAARRFVASLSRSPSLDHPLPWPCATPRQPPPCLTSRHLFLSHTTPHHPTPPRTTPHHPKPLRSTPPQVAILYPGLVLTDETLRFYGENFADWSVKDLSVSSAL